MTLTVNHKWATNPDITVVDKRDTEKANKPLPKKENASEPILKPPEAIKTPSNTVIKSEVKAIDLTSLVQNLDYSNLRVNDNGEVLFDIRLIDKDRVLKIHTISTDKEKARQFATKILHKTSKYHEIWEIIDGD
jgi:hypothetical protein